jgi:uncharacterized protein YjeT (DUF2065 family)
MIIALGLCMKMARAQDKPDATLKLSGGSIGAGVGIVWK